MDLFVTIFTATFNRKNLLKRLYLSLTRQTDYHFEWLIVDDGSEDGSIELLDHIVKSEKNLGFSYRALVRAIAENPYLQYFIGLTQMQMECHFQATSLVYFIKRISKVFIRLANEQLLEDAPVTAEHEDDKEAVSEDGANLGTLILDAACSPSNIKYPQDFVFLNDARVKLEKMIDYFHDIYHPWDKPRTYRRNMRKEYPAVAKMCRRPAKKVRALIRKLLGCLNRDLRYLEEYMAVRYALPSKFIDIYLTIQKLYEQQKYMFDNKTHTVEHRIVSINWT